jgi:hypothetical protein
MNQRENFYVMIEGGEPEFTPIFLSYIKLCLLGTGITDMPWQVGGRQSTVK